MTEVLADLFVRIVAYLVERGFAWLVAYGQRQAQARRQGAVA